MRNDDEVCLQFAWDVVRGKLMDSLSAVKNGVNLSENVGKFEQNPAKQPSSLYAVSEGPRIRLLWRSYQWLKREASILYIVAFNLLEYFHHAYSWFRAYLFFRIELERIFFRFIIFLTILPHVKCGLALGIREKVEPLL